MERDSLLYKIRRRGQVFAHHIISDELLSKIYYRIVLHKKLNLDKPQSFNEKIQWMKLYYYPNNPLVVKASDKYAVRDYVIEKGYKERLVPLLGVWNSADDIDWNLLPNCFVLKCNHGCAYNIVVPDKDQINQSLTIKQLNKWLREDFGAFNIEIHYSYIDPHLILAEEYLGECIEDFKFFCFDGIPKFVYVSSNLIDDRHAKIGFFDLNGNKLPLIRSDYADISDVSFPVFYNEMLIAAEDLSKDFPFVRVDFFVTNNTWYFAELTFTPGAGMMPISPDKYDRVWGSYINLDKVEHE